MIKADVGSRQSLAEALSQRLREHADAKTAAWWQNYVKGSAPFIGVKMATIRAEVRRWHQELVAGELDAEQQVNLALDLFHQDWSELKLAGILYLQEVLLPAGGIECGRDLIRFADLFRAGHIHDWNIGDWFSIKVLASLIRREGGSCARRIAAWHTASNLWQARASLVPFTQFATERAYYPLVEAASKALIQREERFAKTAVGWTLREIWRHDEAFVDAFIEESLSHFSLEALRNALKHAPASQRDSCAKRVKDKSRRPAP